MNEALALMMIGTSALPRIPLTLSAGMSVGSVGIGLLLLSLLAIAMTKPPGSR